MHDDDSGDETQAAAEPRWVYQVVRRELPAIPGEGARYALDDWTRERERKPVITVSTCLPSQRPLGDRRRLLPRMPPKKKKRGGPTAAWYLREQVQPFHGLYRLVRIEPTKTGSFKVHAVCTGPYCGGTKVHVFGPHFWIVSGQSLGGCKGCSNRMRFARRRAEQAACRGEVKGLAS